MVLAQEEARLLNHNYIGTEHILLGLIHEGEGVAATVLSGKHLTLDVCRADVERIVGRGGGTPSGHIPFTPRAKKILEFSLREALTLGHNYIGTEHILLGLVREGEGVSAQVLIWHEIELDAVRSSVIGLLASYGTAKSAPQLVERRPSNQVIIPREDAQVIIKFFDAWEHLHGIVDLPTRSALIGLSVALGNLRDALEDD